MSEFMKNWKKVKTKQPVYIPTADGKQVAETIEVEVDGYVNPRDGEIYLGPEALKQLDDVKARYLGIMLPQEIKKLRDFLGVTQKRLGELLQIGEKSYCRWETGRDRPSRSMNILLSALHDGRIDIAYLVAKSQPPVEWRKMLETMESLRKVAEVPKSNMVSFSPDRPATSPKIIQYYIEQLQDLYVKEGETA